MEKILIVDIKRNKYIKVINVNKCNKHIQNISLQRTIIRLKKKMDFFKSLVKNWEQIF